MGTEALCEWYS